MKKREKTTPHEPGTGTPQVQSREDTAGDSGSHSPVPPAAGEPEPDASLPESSTAPEATADTPIVLDAVITIAEAAVLKEKLLPHSKREGEVKIDGSRVAAVDTAGLQVLLAFARALQKRGAFIRWTGSSDALQNTAQLLGVAGQLGLRT